MLHLGLVLRDPRDERDPGGRFLLAGMVALSTLLHCLAFVLVFFVFRPPDLDVSFELPMDLELGTSETVTATELPAPAAPPAEQGSSRALGAGLDGGLVDAAVSDASSSDAAIARDGGRERARRDGGAPVMATEGDGGAVRIAAGSQIAVRIDMTRIRASPIAADVRLMLEAIPDWQALLEGSGIDPVEQLDRLLIESPNLQREKIVLAGRYLGGETVVREAVAKLAEARGVSAPFREHGSVQVARWANRDPTERVIALIGPTHFAIARAEDLPRVLAIASVRAERERRGEAKTHPADALLAMDANEGLSLEIEGAVLAYLRVGRLPTPEHVHLGAVELPAQRLELRGRLSYADAERAVEAENYVRGLRDRFARNALVSLLGLSAPLEEARIESRKLEVDVRVELSAEQTRLILGYVRELLSPPKLPPRAPGP